VIWEKQWELFAPNFKNGKAHIDLAPYGCSETLQLYPGPGFGDFSHPTTRLVLRLMQPYVKGQPVIDIGCGSGILSLAAAAMGSMQVYGYDIDPEAVKHAKKNLKLSSFAQKIKFSTAPPKTIVPHSILLMNMISSEQEQAWNLIADRIASPATLIASGVLKEDQHDYLGWRAQHGCKLIQSLTEDGWCGYIFKL
jgi:ribosomal protein L11 methyltransferase